MFGSKHRAEEKAEEAAAKLAQARAELRDTVIKLIAQAEGQDASDPDWPLMLKPGERLVSTVEGGGLFEPRREAGHYSGRSAGVSVPVGHTGLRVRVGKSAGTFVQGAEAPAVIDTGAASITTQRIVFQGAKYTREWDYSKLIGIIHYSEHPATAIQVSNRQKTSGIVYAGVKSTEPIRLAMTVAIAIYHGETEETIKELRDELTRLDANPAKIHDATSPPETQHNRAEIPQASSPATPPSPPDKAIPFSPRWGADPSGRHQWRYWDGETWTDYVADNDQESLDPLTSHP